MRKLMTMMLAMSLLSAPAMFAAASKKGGGKQVEKNPAAAKAKIAKEKTQSAAEQKTQK